MRRTKIVCTLGPSSSNPQTIRALIEAGMDVARLNCSHGTQAVHQANFTAVRSIAAELGRNVAILADLQGPKIRTGKLAGGGPVALSVGAEICITAREVPGDARCVSTTYAHLPNDVRPGDRMLLADGTMELRAERVEPPDVHCRVVRGGPLGEHKGINLPGVQVSAPSLTGKDLEDLAFAVQLGVDYVALSFVRSAEDLLGIRRHLSRCAGGKKPGVVAKIERPEAVTHFDAILPLADAIMVARGDLGVEVSLSDVPQIQKELIWKCNSTGTPVITATQMLESMMTSAQPTRAEVTDVANAVYDGTDAVMLSGETAAGQFPIEAARAMAEIAAKADAAVADGPADARVTRLRESSDWRGTQADVIGEAVWRISRATGIARIICFTQSGFTARAIARYRPRTPITAITLQPETLRRCALIWGVEALHSVELHSLDEMLSAVNRLVLERGLAVAGDTIIITAGTPLAVGGVTNLLKLHEVGLPA